MHVITNFFKVIGLVLGAYLGITIFELKVFPPIVRLLIFAIPLGLAIVILLKLHSIRTAKKLPPISPTGISSIGISLVTGYLIVGFYAIYYLLRDLAG